MLTEMDLQQELTIQVRPAYVAAVLMYVVLTNISLTGIWYLRKWHGSHIRVIIQYPLQVAVGRGQLTVRPHGARLLIRKPLIFAMMALVVVAGFKGPIAAITMRV